MKLFSLHRTALPLLYGAAVFAITLLSTGRADARTWTSAADGRQLQATFVGLEGDTIKLKLANGNEVAIPKSRLIPADGEAADRFAVLGDDTRVKSAANKIDGLIAGTLKKNDVAKFNEPLPDDLFARRVYLDIIGRVPTRDEFQRFAENARPDKREALIDELLMHPGYASHLFNYFADMYRLIGKYAPQGIRSEPYIQWWKDQLAENKSYKQIVTDMITAEGNLGHNPASGFLLRDAGMEFDAFSNFSQVFLGIDISCAQCHDHPFEDWTQMDFYRMAAFFGNTQRTTGGYGMNAATLPDAPDGWEAEFTAYAKANGVPIDNRQMSQRFTYYVRALGWNLTDNENLEMALPHDFRGGGGKPGQVVKPRTLVGDAAKTGGKTLREGLAEWMTSPDNPRFATVIANRMWDRAFGKALVEPVHDFSDEQIEDAMHADVLKYVSGMMRGVDYDLREFMRILYNTNVYQSMATTTEPTSAKPYLFTGPVLRRMRAEQAWDSLMLLAAGPDIDQRKGRDGSFLRAVLNVNFEEETVEQVFAKYKAYEAEYRDLGAGVVTDLDSISPSKPDLPMIGRMEMARAAEMIQPAPAASLLDTFGQSDREVTDAHNYDGSVPQVLALMNGDITESLTGSSSKIVLELANLDAPEDKVQAVFFTVLSRYPNPEERQLGVKMLEDYGDDGIRDLAWALLNSPEFLFIQ